MFLPGTNWPWPSIVGWLGYDTRKETENQTNICFLLMPCWGTSGASGHLTYKQEGATLGHNALSQQVLLSCLALNSPQVEVQNMRR